MSGNVANTKIKLRAQYIRMLDHDNIAIANTSPPTSRERLKGRLREAARPAAAAEEEEGLVWVIETEGLADLLLPEEQLPALVLVRVVPGGQ